VSAALAWALAMVFPPTIAALGAVAAAALLTGALHIDGLADTADSYGARDATRALEIMRDHSVGTYGVVAVALDLAVKTAATAALIARPGGLLLLVAAGALSRSTLVGLGALIPYARAEAGLGTVLAGAPRSAVIVAAALATVIAVLSAHLSAIVAAALVGLSALAWAWHCTRRLGGITGDTLGAASEGSEILVLLVGVALS